MHMTPFFEQSIQRQRRPNFHAELASTDLLSRHQREQDFRFSEGVRSQLDILETFEDFDDVEYLTGEEQPHYDQSQMSPRKVMKYRS